MRERALAWAVGCATLLALLGLWELAGALGWINLSLLPSPSQIGLPLWEILASGEFARPLGETLGMFAAGYGLACAVGIALGIAMGFSPRCHGLLEPLVEMLRPIPKPALVPALALFMGIGAGMKITTVALAALFPVLITTLQGVRGVDPVMLDTARTLGCTRAQTLWKIVLPSALPMILTGMRVSLGMGLTLVILAEMMAAETGVGFLVVDLQRSFQVRPMYAWIAILAVVGLLLNTLFEYAEHRAVPWRAR
jgi:ABC-type nitrate/sulfonate/bicarbonate transport system permease component